METLRTRSFGLFLRSLRRWTRWPRRSSAQSVRSYRLVVEALEDRCGPCDLLAASGGSLFAAAPAQPVEIAQPDLPAAPIVDIPSYQSSDSPDAAAAENNTEARPDALENQDEVREQLLPVSSERPLACDWPTLDTLFSVPAFGALGLEAPLAEAASPLAAQDLRDPARHLLDSEVTWTDIASLPNSLPASAFAEQTQHQSRALPQTSTVHWSIGPGSGFVFAAQGASAASKHGFSGFVSGLSSEDGNKSAVVPPGTAFEVPSSNDFPPSEERVSTLPWEEYPDPGSELDDSEYNDPPISDVEPVAILPPPENYSATAEGLTMQAAAPGRLNIVAAAPPRHGPVVTPSIVTSSGAPSVDSVFRVSRTPADGTSLEVHYTLSSYSSAGSANQHGTTVIARDAVHADLAALPKTASASVPEIVVFQLREDRDYRLAKSSATWFSTNSRNGASEAALFAAYRLANSGEAFNALVERHRDTVYQTCFRLLGNRHDAEDLMQLVFLALAKQQVQFQTTLAGWLRMVARNASLTFLRAKRRRARHEQQVARLDLWSGDETPELREELEAALNQVCPPLREAVRLRYLDGWSQHEAAQIVGCPRGTLAQRAAKGIGCLRDLLAARGHLVG
jgi:RNA polymerase sigma-70 factor (ECF subfamily)